MKIKLTLEYDGSGFAGWQVQPGRLTVQGELEKALVIYLSALAKRSCVAGPQSVFVRGSGRTDSGVHARGQVASFSWPEGIPFDPRRFLSALNALTPRELLVHSAVVVDDAFDARYSLHRKCYTYCISEGVCSGGLVWGRSWNVRESLDVPEMIKAAHLLRGRHDFSSFRAADCDALSTVRELCVSEVSRTSSRSLCYTVQGCGFLKHMIRIVVGTLVEVGRGRMNYLQMQAVVEARRREAAGPTAPPQGLTLEWVRYEVPSTSRRASQ